MEEIEKAIDEDNKREAPLGHEDDGPTPGWILDYLDEDFPCDFRPDRFGLQMPKYDPLKHPWRRWNFAQPPSDSCQAWVEKAAKEQALEHFSVLFVPAAFHAAYWRDIVYSKCTEIRILAVPCRLPNKKRQEAHSMVFLVFGPRAEEQTEADALKYPPVYLCEPRNWREGYYKRQRNKERFAGQK
jgi:hypothetical protein